jgi:hypothetical protein
MQTSIERPNNYRQAWTRENFFVEKTLWFSCALDRWSR